jgi:hypothetical protein
MLYDPTRTGVESLKALLSLAVLWAGTVVAGGAATDGSARPEPGAEDDVLGLWAWVVDAPPCRAESPVAIETRFVEFRRGPDGRLEARALVRSNGESKIRPVPRVSFEDGRLRLELDDGVAFHGTLRSDGRSIDGVVESGGDPAASLLRRLDPEPRRSLREPPPLRAA